MYVNIVERKYVKDLKFVENLLMKMFMKNFLDLIVIKKEQMIFMMNLIEL